MVSGGKGVVAKSTQPVANGRTGTSFVNVVHKHIFITVVVEVKYDRILCGTWSLVEHDWGGGCKRFQSLELVSDTLDAQPHTVALPFPALE